MSMGFGFNSVLSNAGQQSLAKYQNTYFYNEKDKQYQSYMQSLGSISTANAYGTACGFNTSAIFGNSQYGSSSNYYSGYTSRSYDNPYYSGSTDYRGKDGLNRNGAVNPYVTKANTIPHTANPYGNGSYGSSLIDNFFVSIQNVALGQKAPTSVFEQRLNYHLDYSDQKKSGEMLGNYSNYFNVDSVEYNKNNYNVFGYSAGASKSNSNNNPTQKVTGSFDYQKAVGAKTVSNLMSILA